MTLTLCQAPGGGGETWSEMTIEGGGGGEAIVGPLENDAATRADVADVAGVAAA